MMKETCIAVACKQIQEQELMYNNSSRFTLQSKLERFLIVSCLILLGGCIALVVLLTSHNQQNLINFRGRRDVINRSVVKEESSDQFQETCENICLSEHCVLTAASLLHVMNQTIDPCSDFYEYACGNWNKQNEIPDDKSSYDTFVKLRDDVSLIVKDLLEQSVGPEDNNATTKAKHLYLSCINEEIIEARREQPLLELLEEFGGWPVISPGWNESHFDLVELISKLRLYNNDALISQWVGPDVKNSSTNIIQLDQIDLGMPSKYHYDKGLNDPSVQAYLKLMIDLAVLVGANEEKAKEDMTDALKFEIKLAEISVPQELRRNYSSIYKRATVKDLIGIVPQINWTKYFETVMPININDSEEIIVFAWQYLVVLGDLIDSTSKRTLANYILWRFVKRRASNLDQRFVQKQQEYNKIMHGVSIEPKRWKKCVSYVNDQMGMAIGNLFIKNNFDEESKKIALEMIEDIRQSFNELLMEVEWMDDPTRELAEEKAQFIKQKIGYPEYIISSEELDKDYADYEIKPDKYFENVLSNLKTHAKRSQENLRDLVNKTIWTTTPVVVNAFYSRNKNQIMFPAGIFQPPFYSQHYPKSMNYGGIGVVIGHEITHGFDDKGRQFDKDGNLKEWWDKEVISRFHEKAQCIIEQYANYTVREVSMQINGVNTQGENIADNGGLKQSFRAYKKWIKKHGEEPLLPGLNLNHDQLFFLNFAHIWCGNMRPEAAITRIQTGAHPPGKFRVIGTLSNSYDFAKTFNCPEDSPMNPKQKCIVW